jgi:hypothetical protein
MLLSYFEHACFGACKCLEVENGRVISSKSMFTHEEIHVIHDSYKMKLCCMWAAPQRGGEKVIKLYSVTSFINS